MHGLVDAPFPVEPVLLDIEELNRRAHTGELDLTKLSFGAFAGVGDRYRLLRSGAALGHGVGPLVVARSERSLDSGAHRDPRPRDDGVPALPARLPGARRGGGAALRRDPRSGRVGEVDAGLIIHESRFTYADHGLVKIADLGEWWEGETGLPVPLAGICARADVDGTGEIEAAIRASVEYAFAHPEASREYVRANSQELSDEVCDQHIALYVNDSRSTSATRASRRSSGCSRAPRLPPPESSSGRAARSYRWQGSIPKGASTEHHSHPGSCVDRGDPGRPARAGVSALSATRTPLVGTVHNARPEGDHPGSTAAATRSYNLQRRSGRGGSSAPNST